MTLVNPHLVGVGEDEETPATRLARRLEESTATVAVVGLGYVGLPLALTLAERGFPVMGVDLDVGKVAAVNAGRSCLRHVDDARVGRLRAGGRFLATADVSRLRQADVIAICVPTPLTEQREPDLSFVTGSAEAIGACLRPGQLVVLESTTYPGTTAEVVLPILRRSGLACGTDFFLAYSPERASPGDGGAAHRDVPRVLGADDPLSLQLATAFYRRVTTQVVPVSGTRAAEATKLLENVFRTVNIALVNELKMIFARMGIDIWEVLEAASTKPFGFMRFDPGPGWGGHCIPIDPFYLAWKARDHGIEARFVELAGEVNLRMPDYVVERIHDALRARGKGLPGARVLLLGIAYKSDVDDVRETPAFPIALLLARLGAQVAYHDPLVSPAVLTRHFPSLAGVACLPLDRSTVEAQDAVVLVTAHRGVDYELVRRHASLIVDTRGVFRDADGGDVVSA